MPSDDSVVVRGGSMTLEGLRERLDEDFEADGVYDISVWTFPDMDAEEIALRVREADPDCNHLPHNRMQSASVGDIRALGLEVLLTEPPPDHHSIRFPARPADNQLEDLMAVFDEPRHNPARRP
jgi:hypothetical protein